MPTSLKRVCQVADVNELITVIGLLERHLVAVEDDLDTTLVSLDGANEELVLQYKKLQIERDDYDDAQKELSIANREHDMHNASLVELFNICAKEGFYQGELDGVLAWAGVEIGLGQGRIWRIATMRKEYNELQAEHAKLGASNTDLSSRITTILVSGLAKDKQLDKLWVRINKLETQSAELEVRNANLEVACTDLESERKAWKARAQESEKQNAELEEQNTSLEVEIKAWTTV